ncbi:MAG: hypothetical protein COV35_00570 [Alphaproteobacteria bacterium CG11_big_fil_rev_8_21_14_0_20_39_49]|nr:MAG: hypothetical protein COV35_00570 [Alphaproteobacteria bacterium CG11_big_fil_rev_8_21_14_0_20_39_49]
MRKAIKFRYISLITLVAFLMNVMLPFFAVYDMQHAMAAEAEKSSIDSMSSLFGDKILICTSDGFKLVSLEDLQNGKERPTPHPEYKCALCYVAANGIKHVVPAQEVALLYQQSIQYISYSFRNDAEISAISTRGFQTRAPPYIA